MQSFDVIIVGGGPAGSTCAWVLRRAGYSVLVMDKSQFPRDKVCAGWITPEVVAALDLNLDDYARQYTLQAFDSFRTGLLGSKMLTTQYGGTVSFGILRREFDHYLLQRSNADLQLGESCESIEQQQGQWCINERYQAPLLIGAGGHFCPVARRLNPKGKGRQEIVTAQELEFELDEAQSAACAVKAETPELYFLPELDGYAWCVRKGRFLNIGLGRTDNHQLSKYVNDFHRYLIAKGRVPADTPAKYHGHAYRLASDRQQRRLLADGVMLIGDAAGLAYPQSGEGIYTAVQSGLLAAKSVINAHGDYRREVLSDYVQNLDHFFGDDALTTPSVLPKTLKLVMARLFFASQYFSRHVLLNKWFLHQCTAKTNTSVQ